MKHRRRVRKITDKQMEQMTKSLPNPVAVAALEGALDAMMKPVVDAGMSPTVTMAMRGTFAMLLGSALGSGKAVLEPEGMEPIQIRKEDAQAIGIRELAKLTRAEVAHMFEQKKK